MCGEATPKGLGVEGRELELATNPGCSFPRSAGEDGRDGTLGRCHISEGEGSDGATFDSDRSYKSCDILDVLIVSSLQLSFMRAYTRFPHRWINGPIRPM